MSWFDKIRDRLAGDGARRSGQPTPPRPAVAAVGNGDVREFDTHDPRDAVFEDALFEEFEAQRQLDDALDGISPATEIEQAETRWRAAVQDREAAWAARQSPAAEATVEATGHHQDPDRAAAAADGEHQGELHWHSVLADRGAYDEQAVAANAVAWRVASREYETFLAGLAGRDDAYSPNTNHQTPAGEVPLPWLHAREWQSALTADQRATAEEIGARLQERHQRMHHRNARREFLPDTVTAALTADTADRPNTAADAEVCAGELVESDEFDYAHVAELYAAEEAEDRVVDEWGELGPPATREEAIERDAQTYADAYPPAELRRQFEISALPEYARDDPETAWAMQRALEIQAQRDQTAAAETTADDPPVDRAPADCERAVNQARQATDRVQHTRQADEVDQHDESGRAARIERWQHTDNAAAQANGDGADRGEGLA